MGAEAILDTSADLFLPEIGGYIFRKPLLTYWNPDYEMVWISNTPNFS